MKNNDMMCLCQGEAYSFSHAGETILEQFQLADSTS